MKGFGLSLLRLLKWYWRPRPLLITGLVVGLAGGAMQTSWPWLPGSQVTTAGGVLLILGVLVWTVRHVLVPDGTGFAALVAVDLTYYALAVGFPVITVALATSGASGSAVAAAASNHGQTGIWEGVGTACAVLILMAVLVCPQLLRMADRPIGAVSEQARRLVPSWLAAVAAVATWIYIFTMRFGRGALSGRAFGTLPVAVGAAGVALLLVPMYQYTVRSCWEHGLENLLDPVRWRSAIRDVFAELSNPGQTAAGRQPGAENSPGRQVPGAR